MLPELSVANFFASAMVSPEGGRSGPNAGPAQPIRILLLPLIDARVGTKMAGVCLPSSWLPSSTPNANNTRAASRSATPRRTLSSVVIDLALQGGVGQQRHKLGVNGRWRRYGPCLLADIYNNNLPGALFNGREPLPCSIEPVASRKHLEGFQNLLFYLMPTSFSEVLIAIARKAPRRRKSHGNRFCGFAS